MKKFTVFAVLGLGVILGTTAAMATIITSNTNISGNWSATGTWVGGVVPASGDTVVINVSGTAVQNTTVTVDSSTFSCARLVFNGSTVNNNTGKVAVGANSFTVSGAVVGNSVSGVGTASTQLTISTGTATVGSVSFAGTKNKVVFSGAGTLNVTSGDFGSGGTLTPSTGTVKLSKGGAQTIGAYTYNNLTLSSSDAKTLGGNTTVGATGTLSRQGTATFALGGFTLTYTTGAVLEYKGSASQTTGDELPATMANGVTINNSNGVILNAATTINGTLTLTSGKVTLGSNNLTIASAGAISGASSSSYIATDGAGKLVRNGVGTSAVSFPVGTTSSYNPATVATGSGTDDFSIRVIGSVSPASANDLAAVQRTWAIAEGAAGGNGSVTVTLQWDSTEEGGSFTPRASAVSWRYNDTAWVQEGTIVNITAPNPVIATITDLTNFSNYTMGLPGELPIQLASFSGSVVDGSNVKLDWSTVSEVNNYGFYVQRRAQSEQNFADLPNSFVEGHATTTEPQQYSWTDQNVAAGSYEYRLRQMDLDGSMSYSPAVSVTVENPTAVGDREAVPAVFKLNQNYPNPFNPSTKISFSLAEPNFTTLKLYNILGQEIATLFNGIADAGRLYVANFDASHLGNGVYLYRLESGSKVDVRKMTLVK